MPRHTETLTPRQRQSQQIMREKAARKRREAWRRKCQFIGGACLGVLLVGGIGLSWYSGAAARGIAAVQEGYFRATAQAGFALRALHVEGRNRTPMAEIQEALGVRKNMPILQLSLAEMRTRLQAVHSIREAAVERILPDGLYVRIVEREPVALWQHQGVLSPVDDQGVVMQGIDSEPYRHLPLIVGEGAPAHVAELVAMLASVPTVAQQCVSAIRVGDRRWNLRLKGDVEVKLPEVDGDDALLRLATIDQEQRLLERDIRTIDLRVPGRMFIKLSPELLKPSNHGAAKEI